VSDDEEIEASRAPLLDHLVELRRRLIISVIALFIGFVICFFFSTQIYILIAHPFSVASGLLAVRQHQPGHVVSADFTQRVLIMLDDAKNMFLVLDNETEEHDPTRVHATQDMARATGRQPQFAARGGPRRAAAPFPPTRAL
jgi:hypothetical protein